ncbi:HAMP domain-containing sensor histidine kinase [Phenylobacterium sp. SCN 70-31]|uniref:sensor histidine kinase n=1 Tax=Phenylobacterium sp. SCN 70-31 TaxID=1660129 RepID=UPI00086B62FA|nr:HAMP domain-containing sensor histidine kinase [Phenylobacterium sp. SCN 70-31]ODT86639.1 MAG: two-component sensor histidine kinase [Phenylobacterium sp. SCN 70-31]
MIERLKDLVAPFWPKLRLRTILFAVLVFAAAMPAIGAIALRVYENTLVRQTEAELVAQGAALTALAATSWPGAPPSPPRPEDPPESYFRPEGTTIDLSRDPVLPERPELPAATRPAASEAAGVMAAIDPVIERTTRTTLASAVVLDARGVDRDGEDYSGLPEVAAALAGRPRTVLRVNGDYRPRYRFEWLSKASGIRLHHARPILVEGQVKGVVLLSRSPRALFRGLYEDRGKFALAAVVILGVVFLMAGLISRGVTRPIETLSAASRRVAEGGGAVPRTPRTSAVEIRELYADFRAMAARIERRSGYLRDFAAAVSHEFKTPLAGITGAVELLQDHFETMSPDERRRFLDNIAGDAERLSQLVTRLLDLARADMASPEAGVATGLAEPVRRAVDGQSRSGFAVAADIPPDLPFVAVPAATLESVLTILLQNARQAGARHATVTATPVDGAVEITVADDGPGVPLADRERLFEPFFTSRRATGGTGLGLPIARSLLAASHASLDLDDGGEGGGALFRMTLPRAD